MKYAVITCINGNFKIESEHGENLEQARTDFYSKCTALSNAPDVVTSKVMVADEFLQPVNDLSAVINHSTSVTE